VDGEAGGEQHELDDVGGAQRVRGELGQDAGVGGTEREPAQVRGDGDLGRAVTVLVEVDEPGRPRPAVRPIKNRPTSSRPSPCAAMKNAIAATATTRAPASGGLRPMWSERRPVTSSPPMTPTPYAAKTTVIWSGESPNADMYSG
jgi:hypothetical protein